MWAKRRKIAYNDDLTTKDLLPEHSQKSLDAAMTMYEEGHKRQILEGMVADVSQSAKRMRMGSMMPTIQKSSTMVCLSDEKKHLFTGNEIAALHGWPTLEFFPKRFRDVLNYDMADYSISHQERMLGDGMSLQMVEAFCTYIFTHCVRKSMLTRVSLSVPKLRSFERVYDTELDDTEGHLYFQCSDD